jgi:UDP-N-acetylglucosamine transferase subunit ALG13
LSGTFVSVGNCTQPFARLLDAVAELAPQLPQPLVVQHGSGIFSLDGADASAFLPMQEFEARVMHAELLILHAGAGSVIHAVRAGRMPVVMPRRAAFGEHVDDHQLEFARALDAAGRVATAETPADLPAAIGRALAGQQGNATANTTSSRMLGLVEATLARYAAEKSGQPADRRNSE